MGSSTLTTTSGENPTDDASIANLAEKLHDMLTGRRESGNLSREEFFFVSMMSWLHLTVDFDSPIVKALRAEASSPEQRLFEIAERVGMAAHKNTKSFFELADPLSSILIQIETGIYNDEDRCACALYSCPGGPETDMRRIITHWSIVTGRDLKTRKVTVICLGSTTPPLLSVARRGGLVQPGASSRWRVPRTTPTGGLDTAELLRFGPGKNSDG